MTASTDFYLELDTTGLSPKNKIVGELHTVYSATGTRLILPNYNAFYSESLKVYAVDPGTAQERLLVKDVDYIASEMLHKVTALVGKSVTTVILILSNVIGLNFKIDYQALGGHDQANNKKLLEIVDSLQLRSGDIEWKDVANKPLGYPPAPHLQDSADIYGLEYVVDQLARIKEAVITGDDVMHKKISDIFNADRRYIIDSFNTVVNQKVDLVTSLIKSSEDSLKVVKLDTDEASINYDSTAVKIHDIENKVPEFKRLNNNHAYANVLNLLCKREHDKNARLIDVPELLGGLYLYLDSDNYSESTGAWMDKRNNGNGFYASSVTPPQYGYSYAYPGHRALKFTNGTHLIKTGTFNLNLVKGRTVVAVLGHTSPLKRIKLPIISDEVKKLDIDTENSVAARYSNNDNTGVSYLAKTSNKLENGAFVNVINIGSRPEDCFCLNNTPFNFYKAPSNVDTENLNLGNISRDLKYIGNPYAEQDAELMMLLIYQRELSVVEMNALLTFIRIKYDANVNYLTNPSFSEGLTNFGTGYVKYFNASQRGCVTVTDKSIAELDTQNTYSDPYFPNPSDIKIEQGKYLFVLTDSPNINFWNQEIKLEPNCRYVLKFSIVYGSINRPVIRLKINGAFHPNIPVLPGDRAIANDLTFSFTTTKVLNKLELFNLNTATVGNSFGIDKMSLVRIIYA